MEVFDLGFLVNVVQVEVIGQLDWRSALVKTVMVTYTFLA